MTGNGFPDDLDFEQNNSHSAVRGRQKIFRRYILQKILGRGGMGVVWLAQDEDLERLVALKVLPETLCHDHASLEALKRETKLGLNLAHPNIVRIYDFQRDDNAAAIRWNTWTESPCRTRAAKGRNRCLARQICNLISPRCATRLTMRTHAEKSCTAI